MYSVYYWNPSGVPSLGLTSAQDDDDLGHVLKLLYTQNRQVQAVYKNEDKVDLNKLLGISHI